MVSSSLPLAAAAFPTAAWIFSSWCLARAGSSDDAEFDFEQFRLARGDRVLLCSDGLTRAVPDPELERALAQAPAPEAAVRAMIEAALAAGAQDNVTAVAVFFE